LPSREWPTRTRGGATHLESQTHSFMAQLNLSGPLLALHPHAALTPRPVIAAAYELHVVDGTMMRAYLCGAFSGPKAACAH
jgi:hypothetical protein